MDCDTLISITDDLKYMGRMTFSEFKIVFFLQRKVVGKTLTSKVFAGTSSPPTPCVSFGHAPTTSWSSFASMSRNRRGATNERPTEQFHFR